MIRLLIILMLPLSACIVDDRANALLYVSNTSTEDFEKALFSVYINGKNVFNDTVDNEYLSFHWTEKEIVVPKDPFTLKTILIGENYSIQKDTLFDYKDSLQIFVRFNFSLYYKRYTNPEIYKHIEGEISNFKSLADTLYSNKLLSNPSEFLNDTLPLKSSLEMFVK